MCALFPCLSLSQPHIWGFDKYFYSEVNKWTSGMFLYEVVPLRWHGHLGSMEIFSIVKARVLCRVDLENCLGCLVTTSLIY